MAISRICSIDGCSNKHAARGLCNKHFKRLRRHGDPLRVDKPISERGAPRIFLNEHLGTEHSDDDCVFWPFAKNDQGYGQMLVDGEVQYVHRVVCEFHNGRPSPEANKALHSCGNGHLACINEKHLRWGTLAQNQADSRAHGTMTLGEQVNTAKLTADDVVALRSGRFEGMSQRAIAAHLDVSQRTVSDILTGKTWRHLP